MRPQLVELGELMPGRGVSVDPAKHPDEEFALFSVPAYDSQVPDRVKGRQIGSSKQVVQPGDVLLSKIVPHIRRAWIVPESDQRRQIGSSEWIIFRSPRFHGPYLRHLLISDQFNSKLMQTVSGVGGSLLRARPTGVAKIKVPLPSIEEQRRIAAILDKAEELRAKRRAAIALLDQLPQAIFLEMFGDPAVNSMDWPVVRVADIAEKVDYGVTASAKNTPVGPKFLRITDIQHGQVRWDSVPFCTCTERERAASQLRTGDIVFARTGATTGKSFLITECPEGAVFASYLIRVRPNHAIAPWYLAQFFQSDAYWAQVGAKMRGAGQPGVNSTSLKELTLPLPSVDLQQRFAARVDAIHRAKAAPQSALAECDALFASLQASAFGTQA